MEVKGVGGGVKDQPETRKAMAEEQRGGDSQWSTKAEARNKLWAARHNAYYAAKALFPGQLGLATDICVPISKLATAIEDTQNDLAQNGVTAAIIGHVGDGNYHALMFSDPNKPDELTRNKALAHRMVERGLELGGTCTGEHGIGMGKMKYMAAEHGPALSAMADIKRAFDPQNIMNPGKMIPMN